MTKLSIIICTYNVSKLLSECLTSIEKNFPKQVASGEYEIIISDNASKDNTAEVMAEYKKKTKIKRFIYIRNNDNLGFSRANNVGVKEAKGEYVLFLNADMVVNENVLPTMLSFMDKHPEAGAATCKLVLANGKVNDACHRGFPTPWNAFCHFSKLEKLFPKTKLFASYTLGWMNFNTTHEIDALAGSFLLTPRKAGEQIGWWDEDYFLYGEDIDFCYNLKEKGWKIYYVPEVEVFDYKGASMGIQKISQHLSTASRAHKIRMQNARFNAMKIFYEKHYKDTYSPFVMSICFLGINTIRAYFMSKIPKATEK